jgi:hypothetical protein
MMPPSPDKFPPHLAEVITKNRSQVVLVFDEEISGERLVADSFVLTGADAGRLELRGVSLGRRSDEVAMWTPTQSSGLYEVKGIVWDVAGNPGRFRARFRGSAKADTIAPRVVRVEPGPGAARQRGATVVRVGFSEVIDTGKAVSHLFAPREHDTCFQRAWSTDWQVLTFGRRESLRTGEIVYLVVLPGARDLEGNRCRGPAFTYFSPDSFLDVVPVKGRALWREKPAAGGVVLFSSAGAPESSRTLGLAPILADGAFFTKVRKGEYVVEAVSDTDMDGRSDLAGSSAAFNTDSESLNLFLEPETLPRPLDAYRR